MEKLLKIGEELESNTTYYTNEKKIEVFMKDTVVCTENCIVKIEEHKTDKLNVCFWIKNKENITIDFGGAVLFLHGKIQPFLIQNSKNIKIKNVKIINERSTYTQGEMIEIGENYVKLKISDGDTIRVENGELIPYCNEWENHDLNKTNMWLQSFGKDRRGTGLVVCMIGKEIHKDPTFPFDVNQYVPSIEDGILKLEGDVMPGWRVGDYLAIAHEKREVTSFFMESSENIFAENVDIINGAGMGFFPIHTKNIYLNGLRYTKSELSKGAVFNMGDALHTFGCSGDFVIENCIFEGMIDDALNIHNDFCLFDKCEGNILYAKASAPHANSYLNIIDVNDEIAIYKEKTMECVGKYKVLEKEFPDDKTFKLTLDKPLLNHKEGDLIENLSAQPNITIRNTKFGKANSHLRFQSRGKILVENCEIELPVLLTGDASFWFESSPVNDFTLQNCKFTLEKSQIRLMPEVMPTEKEPYYHKNIRILNNTFVTDNPIKGGYSDNIEFLGNTNIENKKMKLILTNCGDVKADNCEIERITEVKTELKVN